MTMATKEVKRGNGNALLFKLIWLWIALLCLSNNAEASSKNITYDLVFNRHDFKVVINTNFNFTASIRPRVNKTLNVYLTEDNKEADIVKFSTTNFTFKRGNPEECIFVKANNAGHVTVSAVVYNGSEIPPSSVKTDEAYVGIRVYHSYFLDIFSDIIGWTYFFSWTFSFYPQIWENFQRKSVIGLNFDYLALNFVGHSCYNVFNIGLFLIPAIKAEYFDVNKHGVNPVQINDLAFSMHAVFATFVTIVQACIYERAGQKVSFTCKLLLGGFAAFLIITLILALVNTITWLEYIYYVSYVKLVITLIKCVPQAYLNYKRKSTVGWSIGNVLMDFVGGTLSCLQMFIIAYNYNDWSSIFGDPTKFGLGFFSVMFDVLFIIQHYLLYRNMEDTRYLVSDDRNSVTSHSSIGNS